MSFFADWRAKTSSSFSFWSESTAVCRVWTFFCGTKRPFTEMCNHYNHPTGKTWINKYGSGQKHLHQRNFAAASTCCSDCIGSSWLLFWHIFFTKASFNPKTLFSSISSLESWACRSAWRAVNVSGQSLLAVVPTPYKKKGRTYICFHELSI